MDNTTETRVKKVIGELADRDPSTLTDGMSLASDLRFDSLGRVELILSLEEEFETTLDEADTGGVTTVGEVVKFVEGRLNG